MARKRKLPAPTPAPAPAALPPLMITGGFGGANGILSTEPPRTHAAPRAVVGRNRPITGLNEYTFDAPVYNLTFGQALAAVHRLLQPILQAELTILVQRHVGLQSDVYLPSELGIDANNPRVPGAYSFVDSRRVELHALPTSGLFYVGLCLDLLEGRRMAPVAGACGIYAEFYSGKESPAALSLEALYPRIERRLTNEAIVEAVTHIYGGL